jgi:hypothetical protein
MRDARHPEVGKAYRDARPGLLPAAGKVGNGVLTLHLEMGCASETISSIAVKLHAATAPCDF